MTCQSLQCVRVSVQLSSASRASLSLPSCHLHQGIGIGAGKHWGVGGVPPLPFSLACSFELACLMVLLLSENVDCVCLLQQVEMWLFKLWLYVVAPCRLPLRADSYTSAPSPSVATSRERPFLPPSAIWSPLILQTSSFCIRCPQSLLPLPPSPHCVVISVSVWLPAGGESYSSSSCKVSTINA